MTKKLITWWMLCIAFIWSQSIFAQGNVVPDAVKQLVESSENQIDIGIAALTLAKETYPDLDIVAYSKKIDLLAEKVRTRAKGSFDPETRIRAMNSVLYLEEGFRYDHNPTAREKPENYYLNKTLDTKLGICYTLPLLYIAVAQRARYPIYPVAVPDHFFVRYTDPVLKEQNIETTSGGKYLSDGSYIRHFAVSKRGMASGSYMRVMTYREYLGDILSSSTFGWGSKVPYKAHQYAYVASQLNPRSAHHFDNLQRGFAAMSNASSGKTSAEYRRLAEQAGRKAKALGFVDPSETEYEQRRRFFGG